MYNGKEAKVERLEKDFADIPAGSTMLIATPLIVDGYIKHIARGHTGSLQQMRKDLAAQYHAQYTCPITSGIFLRIVAEAAYEQYEEGMPLDEITPFWRMIDSRSPTAKKLSFGVEFIKLQRKKEGLSY
jgi:hypothetical protein